MPKVLAIDPLAPDAAVIAEAVEALQKGHLVVLPTETVYGLCGHPDRPEAVRAMYEVKGRDPGKPLAFLACDIDQVRATDARFTAEAERVAQRFWPGPLTLVLPVGDQTVGFRVPDHKVPRCVMKELGCPILATSANRSGQPDATTASEAVDALGDDVALVLDAGPSEGAVASTVLLALQDRLEVLREGALSRAQVEGAA